MAAYSRLFNHGFSNLINHSTGSSDTSVITVKSIGGFNQPVQLTVLGAPSGVTATLNPQQVTPPPDGSVTSTLTVSVTTTATPGTCTLTITGTSGALTHSVDISLKITAPLISDIAITKITFSKEHLAVNETIQIYVTVENRGNFTETFDVSANYTLLVDPLIGTQTITLAPRESLILNLHGHLMPQVAIK